MEAARLKLPICAKQQHIMETINNNPVIIITGETGSGKTTQIPQFLYEAGYARERMIGITEPRRIAAMSTSKRVAEEMNLTQDEVSYLIRFGGNVTEKTKIKFMTDGVLLRKIARDSLLKKYSVIIVDEAHERSVHTDILIGSLSRIVLLRDKCNDPLKLIIMSATLQAQEFVENARLFTVKPPVIKIEGRQFPVTKFFSRQKIITTKKNYVSEAFRMAVRIHTRLPEGGQQEIHTLVNHLRETFPSESDDESDDDEFQINLAHPVKSKMPTRSNKKDNSKDEFQRKAMEALCRNDRKRSVRKKHLCSFSYSAIPTRKHQDSVQEDIFDEDEEENVDLIRNAGPLRVLPLYSLLDAREQAKVFETPPKGCRLCIVSTNVAETSLTIPNIRYVIDSGYYKMKRYDKVTGVQTFDISYISKAAAEQRAGRAGRTAPGCCYRLYSSAVFKNKFEEYDQPEIQRTPLDDLVLKIKMMGNDRVMNFPFPTQPNNMQLQAAEDRLTILGALEPSKEKEEAKLTPLGRKIALFPVAPRYGKMLVLSEKQDLIKYIICLVAGLSVRQLFAKGTEGRIYKRLQLQHQLTVHGYSLLMGDLMLLLKIIIGAEYAASVKDRFSSFCYENGLRHETLVEIGKLRRQLINEINSNIPNLNLAIDPKMLPPNDVEAELLCKIILTGMADQVAKKISPDEMMENQLKTWKYAYRTAKIKEPIFMHSSCVLWQTEPEWVVYQEVHKVDGRIYMRGVTAIDPQQLPKFAPTLCNLDEPANDSPARYDPVTGKIMCRVSGTFGEAGWKLPMVDIEYPLTLNGVKWFAFFFLEGEVCPKLKPFVPLLAS
ncbi:putative ATP-dependent RNA helicase kurz [Ooceraea biroi]|uniref:RNA helicase n=1 Tax=Ooceraea biroi TaxID=2015173 RepID=A0A026WWN2_OOCBI|nr:putative ATP-dependent RNA helicase kurz [Ooceraea biroi]